MKAKMVDESMSFERGGSAKASLGIGEGISLGKEKYDMKEDSKRELEDNWKMFLHNLLDGKTITAEMTKMGTFNLTTREKLSGSERGKFTVKIKEWQNDTIDKTFIVIFGSDNIAYQLFIDDRKVFVE